MGNISGAMAAAPIWTEFMKRAAVLPQYRNMKPFGAPSGVVIVKLDKATNRLATASCPDDYTVAFIAGTEPKDTCDGGGILSRLGHLFSGGNGSPPNVVAPPSSPSGNPGTPVTQAPQPAAQTQSTQPEQKKKKGFWGKVFGVFKDDDKNKPPEKQ